MKFNELHKATPKKAKARAGRGISAGRGKTAGRGTKGQGSRKSGGVRPGFEGGQTPLYMRLPKLRGFKSHRIGHEIVYSGQLDALKKSQIDNTTLFEAKLVKSPYSSVKVLLNGEVKSPKQVKLQAASEGAVKAINSAGGSFSVTTRQAAAKKPAS